MLNSFDLSAAYLLIQIQRQLMPCCRQVVVEKDDVIDYEMFGTRLVAIER